MSDEPRAIIITPGQVLIYLPVSLLVAGATTLLTLLIADPNAIGVNNTYITLVTPHAYLLSVYWVFTAALLVLQALVLTTTRNEQLIRVFLQGPGFIIPAINISLSLWIIAFTFRWFVAAFIFIAFVFGFSALAFLTIFSVQPTSSAPITYLAIHLPVRLLLAESFTSAFWHSLYLAIGWYTDITEIDPKTPSVAQTWIVFGVLFATGIVNSGYVFWKNDTGYAIATGFIYLMILVKVNTANVWIASLLCLVGVFTASAAAIGWKLIQTDQEGVIRLDDDNEDQVAATAPTNP